MNGMKDNHIKVVGAYLNQTSKEEGLGDSFLGPTMRSSRLRTFLYAVVLGVMCLTVFLLSTTHSRLKDIENTNEKCQQQRDSLSAQLQVVYEHKNRLEKSLQQEKTDHKHTKEVLEKQLNDLRVENEKDKHSSESKYNSLLQEHETIQNKNSQLQEQLAELRNSFSQLEDEKKQIDSSLRVQLHSLQEKKDAEINKLHAQLNDLLSEKDQLQQINMNREWKIKQNTEALHLCQLQYQQLQEQLSLQLKKQQLSTGGKDQSANKADVGGDIEPPIGNDHNEKVDDDNHHDKQNLQADANVSKHEAAAQPRGNQQKVLERPNVHMSNGNKAAKSNMENSNLIPDETAHKNHAKDDSLEVNNDHDFSVNHANRVLEPPAYHNHEVGFHGMSPGRVSFEGELQDGKSPEGEQEHLPQVQPPHNFDKVDEKNSFHQDEEGRNDDTKHQLEQPSFHSVKDINKNEYARLQLQNSQELNPNNIAPLQNAAQDQGVLVKPPAEDNIMGQLQSNHNLNRQQKQGHDNKVHGWVENLKRGPQVVNKRNVPAEHQDEDGDYADGDDDGDDQGDDDQVIAGQGVRGKVFQDADFDDQDNLEVDEKNVPNPNQDKEEGVMVAPK